MRAELAQTQLATSADTGNARYLLALQVCADTRAGFEAQQAGGQQLPSEFTEGVILPVDANRSHACPALPEGAADARQTHIAAIGNQPGAPGSGNAYHHKSQPDNDGDNNPAQCRHHRELVL